MYFLTAILHMSIFCAFALPGAAPLPQDEEVRMTNVEDDLEFAVNLARNRYFDLADEFVERIKKQKLTDDEKSTLLLTNASILKLASENETDERKRTKYYQDAIARFTEFVDYNTHHPKFDESRLDLARVKVNLGQYLCKKMQLTEDPEKRADWQAECKDHFGTGIELFSDLQRVFRNNSEVYQESGDQEMADEFFTLFRKTTYEMAVAYYYWALTYDPDEFNREDYLERSIDTLDDYIWESPEDDFYALWAYIYQGMAYMELGNYSDALDLAMQVYDPDTGVDLDQTKGLTPEYAKLITDITETAYFHVARIYTRMGEYEQADQTVENMVEQFTSRGMEMSPLGDQARLVQARALMEMSDAESADRAAQICKDVGDRNPSNDVGREAKIILKSIIEGASSDPSRGTISLSPDVLFAAAEGAKLEQNYRDAIKAYMKVLEAANTTELKKQFLTRCWNAIGECYSKLKRYLEASIAYERGFTDPDRGPDKEIFESNAMNWYGALTQRHKETKDSYDEKKKKAARNRLVQLNVSTDLRFMIANDKFNKALTLDDGPAKDQGLQDALEEFDQMDKQSAYYERSMVYKARCYFEMKKYDDALKEFDDFRAYIGRVGTPGTPKQKTKRVQAQAEEAYWRSENFLRMKKYEETLACLDGFENTFKNQTDFIPAVVYNRMLAKLGLEDFQTGEKLYKEMESTSPDSIRIPAAAYYLARSFNEKADAIRGDVESEPSREYLQFRKKCAEYMYIYCEKSNFDSFTNLKNVCEWYKELGDYGEKSAWEISKRYYEKLIKEFGKNPEHKDEIESSAYRGYGEVLLSLHDFQTARPIWLKLLNANKKSITVLRATGRCLGGWLEYRSGSWVEIPGAGVYAPDPADKRDPNKIYLDTALGIWNYVLRGIDDAGNKYSPEWWEAKFSTAYVVYRAGEQYPSYFEVAKRVIDNQKLFRPELGGPDMRRKFSYLEKTIKKRL
ncbi:MAG: tetratricopeptide repeat protein [Planctomycetota bacterium]|jgi:tetratricopeptide (TPR) repeat protein